MTCNNKKIVLITMGDAAGIGPEISVKASLDAAVRESYLPVIIGDLESLKKLRITNDGSEIHWNVLDEKLDGKDIICEKDVINVIDVKFEAGYHPEFGKPDVITGKYSFLYVEKAVKLIQQKFADCMRLVTAPISKKFWQKAGIEYLAHTEALAAMTGTEKYAMIFANDFFSVVLVTRHVSIKHIPEYFNKKSFEDALDIGIEFLDKLGVKDKKIGVCGLNPHAGEDGQVGHEEIEIIEPVLSYPKYKNINFFGPMTGDAIFEKARLGAVNLVIAAYHDQGIFPLKAMDYYGCVNITVGLPFTRVSPGHGTAFDIAGKNKANAKAMVQAILWSGKFVE